MGYLPSKMPDLLEFKGKRPDKVQTTLNFDWLLLGRGEMLYKDCEKSNNNATDEKFRTNPNNSEDVIGLMGILSKFLLNQQQNQDVVKDMVTIYERINNK